MMMPGCSTKIAAPWRNAGMGDLCSDAYYIAKDPSYSAWNPLKQAAIANLALCEAAGWAYERIQYGTIPPPTGVPLPVPSAPQTEEQMTVPGAWTPEQSTPTRQDVLDWSARVQAQIAEAERAGTYNPEGNLPVTAEWLSSYKWWILGGLGAVGLLVLIAAAKR